MPRKKVSSKSTDVIVKNSSFLNGPSVFEKFNIDITDVNDNSNSSTSSVFNEISFESSSNINKEESKKDLENQPTYLYRNSDIFNNFDMLNKKLIIDFVQDNSYLKNNYSNINLSNIEQINFNNSIINTSNVNADSINTIVDNTSITDVNIKNLQVDDISINIAYPITTTTRDSIEIGNTDIDESPDFEFTNAINILEKAIVKLQNSNK